MEDDAGFWVALEYGDDVGVGADGDTFGFEVGPPFAIEFLEMGEGDHEGKVGQEGFGVVIPELHVGVVKEAFENSAGDVCSLVAYDVCESLVVHRELEGDKPVPRKRAMSGKTILSPNSLLKKNIRSIYLMGTRPSIGMVYLMILRTLPNFLMSPEKRSTKWLGKQLVQKLSWP